MLIRDLVRLCLLEPSTDAPPDLRTVLSSATEPQWRRVLPELDEHRLSPLVAWSLEECGLAGAVPADVLGELRERYQGTLLANHVHAGVLEEVLERLGEESIAPVVMKGLVLADHVYPDLGTRPMLDVDVLVAAHEADRAADALRRLGLDRSRPWRSFQAEGEGLAVDLHAHGKDAPFGELSELTRFVPLRSLHGRETRVWDPDAMLAHLVGHLDKHTRVVGPSLLWVLDIVLLVRERGSEFDAERVHALMGSGGGGALLPAILRFAAELCAAPVPSAFEAEVERARPISLDWILRQRRLQRWGFPRRRFYVRIGARLLRLRPREGRQWPRWHDVPNGWLDAIVDRRTIR
ncbi:MAG: nucleotidyltransferase family protein [Planctomycetota bacterium]